MISANKPRQLFLVMVLHRIGKFYIVFICISKKTHSVDIEFSKTLDRKKEKSFSKI